MSALFYYKIVLITELLVAEFLISFRKKKRRLFAERALRCAEALAGAARAEE